MRLAAVVVVAALALTATAGARVIAGTAGSDRLVGTPRADLIDGRAGRDVLVGRAGADYLQGGAGRDTLDGGAGADRIAASYDGSPDSIRCGAGADLVNADPTDLVARDCELVGRRISRDPYRTTDAQHETEVEPDSFTFGRTTVAAFQVGRRFSGGATNVGFAVSNDDGATWRSGLLPGLTIASAPPGPNRLASDPVVAYDAAHRTWLISTLALEGATTRLAINRSPDGTSWSTAINAAEETAATAEGIAFDKNWAACDNAPTSPRYGRCYLVYTHSADRDMLAVTWSDDGGLTWSTAVDIGARPAVGVFPVIRPTGDLVVAYLWELGRFAIATSTSSDGGASWGPPVRVADIAGGCGVSGLRAFPLPSADVDANGRIWVTWHDCAVSGASQSAVFVSTSNDGAAWSAPTAVTRGSRSAVLPAIGIDATTGRVAIAYLRDTADGIHTELVVSPGTVAFGTPRRLSAEASALASMADTTSGRMLGDYFSLHYAGGRPLVVWVLALAPVAGAFREAVYATRG